MFARAPRRGTVKRRLAAAIGDGPALRFYRSTLLDLLRRLGRDPRWTTWLALTPDRAAVGSRRWPGRPRPIPQGGGDLGARMGRVLRPAPRSCGRPRAPGLPPGAVVIVGSDIPGLGRGHVAAAFRALGAAPVVIGPAADGGYWLIGARRRPHPPAGLFRAVRWSTRHALADTLAGLPAGTRVARLDTLPDIDDGEDWRRHGGGKEDWRRYGGGKAESARRIVRRVASGRGA